MGLLCKLLGHKYVDVVTYDKFTPTGEVVVVIKQCKRCKGFDVAFSAVRELTEVENEVAAPVKAKKAPKK